MKSLPVIVGFGGYNSAGRSSGHNAYLRMIYESLDQRHRVHTLKALGAIMGIEVSDAPADDVTSKILAGTLIRRIEPNFFDVNATPIGRQCELSASESSPITMTMAARDVPNPLPYGWTLKGEPTKGQCEIEIWKSQAITVQTQLPLPVQAAGQLPTGFNPGSYYRSTHHPRGLQLTVLSASDAVRSTGLAWEDVVAKVSPDQVAVYASSVMSQLDGNGLGGMMQNRMRGQRVSSKQLALGLSTMAADFVNAYVLGSVGTTAGISGACATFAYNLKAAVNDIQSGRCKVALVGSSEAPILPEVIEGYAAMSALATDDELRRLDGTQSVDHRRSSRPFGDNCGFTIAESGQYVMLMADELAIEMGAQILGMVPGVFVNADGYKKSISAPGPGNYITMAKACALTQQWAGEQVLQQQSFIQAHGSSTPHNRVTESKIFDEVARTFGVERWPVTAVKAYLGHSLGPASADQLAASLGVFAYGVLPGIKTIDKVAEDVHDERLQLSNKDLELGKDKAQVALLNSKGFGGNNATAAVFSPSLTEDTLQKKYTAKQWKDYLSRRSSTLEAVAAYEEQASAGKLDPIYHFGEGVIDETQIKLTQQAITLPGFKNPVGLLGTED